MYSIKYTVHIEKDHLLHIMETIGKTVLTAFFTYGAHYGITKIYSVYCIPDGPLGFFHGVLTTGSPVCTSVFSAMSHTHVTYGSIILTSLSRLIADLIVPEKSKSV